MNILKILTERRLTGNFGEDAAAKMLKKKGCKIIARNKVEGEGEIDIVAEDSEFLLFVEVKTRRFGVENPSEPRAASSVTPEKQRRIIKAAKSYISYRPTDKKIRFDVVEVYYDTDGKRRYVREINHLEGAFNMNTAKGYTR